MHQNTSLTWQFFYNADLLYQCNNYAIEMKKATIHMELFKMKKGAIKRNEIHQTRLQLAQ